MATAQKRRRAYIGNLRPRPNLSRLLHDNLFVPHCLPVKNFPDGNGIAVAQPKIPNGNHRNNSRSKANTSAYALVEFGDVEYAIQMLNGVQFDGRVLRVSREKVNFGNGGGGQGRSNMGGGFGSGRWAGDDGSGGSSKNNFSGRGNHRHNSRHSKASRVVEENNNAARDGGADAVRNEMIVGMSNREEEINKMAESLISSEIKESSDEITAAIACTAAMTLLSTVDAFGLDEEGANNGLDSGSKNGIEAIKNDVKSNDMTDKDFQSRRKIPLSELLAEYGQQDVDWKKQQQQPNANEPQDCIAESENDMTTNAFQSRCQMPLSDLLAEYGEQDISWKKDQTKPPSTHSNSKYNTKNTKPNSQPFHKEHKNSNNGMLAHFDKAFVHLELLSFGYKYGAPSHSKRGFTYAQPLPSLDVRDLDRAPGHVAKFNGLSYLVKRALLNPSKGTDNGGGTNNEKGEDRSNKGSGQSPMRNRANEIADEIIKVLVESIDEGGHGPISPLTMTVSIGSEYGRHRSVVLVEHLAVVLRARLRRNDGCCFNDSVDGGSTGGLGKNGIVQQPVSVGTRHRDVEARHTDEEAFGEDLKREARKAEKVERARRRQKEESGWDDDSW